MSKRTQPSLSHTKYPANTCYINYFKFLLKKENTLKAYNRGK